MRRLNNISLAVPVLNKALPSIQQEMQMSTKPTTSTILHLPMLGSPHMLHLHQIPKKDHHHHLSHFITRLVDKSISSITASNVLYLGIVMKNAMYNMIIHLNQDRLRVPLQQQSQIQQCLQHMRQINHKTQQTVWPLRNKLGQHGTALQRKLRNMKTQLVHIDSRSTQKNTFLIHYQSTRTQVLQIQFFIIITQIFTESLTLVPLSTCVEMHHSSKLFKNVNLSQYLYQMGTNS